VTELVPASLPLKNERHEAFCLQYAESDNAPASYVAAGFSPGGARQAAHKLLQRSDILARVEYLRRELRVAIASKRAETAAALLTPIRDRKQALLEELELLAFSDITNYTVDDDGWITVKGDLPADFARAVESVQVDRSYDHLGRLVTKTKFKLWSKPTALKMLGDHERLFGEQPEGGRPGDRPTQVFIIAGREVYL
jgi:hypothetical protein